MQVQIRVVEHSALNDLVAAAESGAEPARVDLSPWSRERGALIDQWGRRTAA
jgi:hypothetical protein